MRKYPELEDEKKLRIYNEAFNDTIAYYQKLTTPSGEDTAKLSVLEKYNMTKEESVPLAAIKGLIYFLPQDSQFSQGVLVKRMQALGYETDDKGQCFGVSLMATQAFLGEEILKFNERLRLIQSMPFQDFENNFELLRRKRENYLKQGLQVEADKINETIVDLLAFFDGVALHQAPFNYPHLFENSS